MALLLVLFSLLFIELSIRFSLSYNFDNPPNYVAHVRPLPALAPVAIKLNVRSFKVKVTPNTSIKVVHFRKRIPVTRT